MVHTQAKKGHQDASKQRALHNSNNGSHSANNSSSNSSSVQSLNNSNSNELVVNSNSNFSTNCTSASSSPSSSPISFGSAASPSPPKNAAQQLASKVASLNTASAASTNQQHLLSNVHLAQQALHQANVSSLITNHSANHSTNHHHQLTTTTNNQTAQPQLTLTGMVNNSAIDLTAAGLNAQAAQFNQFFPSLHHQFWQGLSDPFYRPFVS